VALRGGSYVVRQGDVLGSIAQRELGSSKRWKEIVALNPGLDPERLLVGARLTMPSPTAATAAKSPPQSPAKSTAKSPTKSTGTQVAKATAPAAQGGWSSSAAGSKVR
jgi:LysM repeat protein